MTDQLSPATLEQARYIAYGRAAKAAAEVKRARKNACRLQPRERGVFGRV